MVRNNAKEYPKQLNLFSVCLSRNLTKTKRRCNNEHHKNTEHYQGESYLL